MPEEKPLLIFPRPLSRDRDKGSGGANKIHLPDHLRQSSRLQPKFQQLENIYATLQRNSEGLIPEQVLVLETVGSVEDFIVATKHVAGMELLGEYDEDEILPDEDFYQDESNKDKLLKGRVYLTLANQQALRELLSLWNHYKENENYKFRWGQTKWRHVFKQLKEIRPWGVEDRSLDTGIKEDLDFRLSIGEKDVRFEVEVWFRENGTQREASVSAFNTILNSEGGFIVDQAIIPEIAYHGVLVEAPLEIAINILNNKDYYQVRFFRPVGQVVAPIPEGEPLVGDIEIPETTSDDAEPVVALFDGLPLENHSLLANRLSVDDPDGFGADYIAQYRVHGTGMASLILYGELDAKENSLKRKLYVRPIFKLYPQGLDRSKKEEKMPEDQLAVDLIHRAVLRLYKGENGESPVAPQIRIINLSIGDPSRQFIDCMSPLARLLDWLAYEYNILFIVSAGNNGDDIVLETERQEFEALTPTQLEKAVLKALNSDSRNRRLLSPAESLNSITVGALHDDLSDLTNIGSRINVFDSPGLPSPYNSLGLGYRRSIKPDILFAGGQYSIIAYNPIDILSVLVIK